MGPPRSWGVSEPSRIPGAARPRQAPSPRRTARLAPAAADRVLSLGRARALASALPQPDRVSAHRRPRPRRTEAGEPAPVPRIHLEIDANHGPCVELAFAAPASVP